MLVESILCVSVFDMDVAASEDEITYTDSCITVSVAVISVAIGIVVASGIEVAVGNIVSGINVVVVGVEIADLDVVALGIVVAHNNVVDDEVIGMKGADVSVTVSVPVDRIGRVKFLIEI